MPEALDRQRTIGKPAIRQVGSFGALRIGLHTDRPDIFVAENVVLGQTVSSRLYIGPGMFFAAVAPAKVCQSRQKQAKTRMCLIKGTT